jgi:hypothetical protein
MSLVPDSVHLAYPHSQTLKVLRLSSELSVSVDLASGVLAISTSGEPRALA